MKKILPLAAFIAAFCLQIPAWAASPANTYCSTDSGTTWLPCNPTGGGGGGSGPPYATTPLGYQQLTSVTTSTALTVPGTATYAIVTVEAQTVRYRDDGVAPTATVGMPLPAQAVLVVGGAAELAAIRFIQATAGAIIDVSYYK
jgi:hypothetical protein